MGDLALDEQRYSTLILLGDPEEKSLGAFFKTNETLLPSKEDMAHRFRAHSPDGQRKITGTASALDWLFEAARKKVKKRVGRGEKAIVSTHDWGDEGDFLIFCSAPHQEIENFWWNEVSWGGYYYLLLPVKLAQPSAYQHRLLALRHHAKKLQSDTHVEMVAESDDLDFGQNLWPHFRTLEMNGEEVQRYFVRDERKTISLPARKGINAIGSSLFLPPFRIIDDPDLPMVAPFDRVGSYFDSKRITLRKALRDASGATVPYRRKVPNGISLRVDPIAPLNIQALHATDHPLIRDVLRDGGHMTVSFEENEATCLTLQFPNDQAAPGAAYRKRFFVEKTDPIGPPDLYVVRDELRKDLQSILPKGLELSAADPEAAVGDWTCKENLGRFAGRDADGTSRTLDELSNAFGEPTPMLKKALDFWVTDDAGRRGTRTSVDNDLAERLFINHCWRHPSGIATTSNFDSDEQRFGWRLALVTQLTKGEIRPGAKLVTPQARVDRWNAETDIGHIMLHQDGDRDWTLEYSGARGHSESWKLLFLLPLGTKMISKGFILDDRRCSRLDAGNVLG